MHALFLLLALQNDLTKKNYDLYCALCPCGAFLDVTPEVEACVASIIDAYPDARVRSMIADSLLCSTNALQQQTTCLNQSSRCSEADLCGEQLRTARDDCDAMFMLGDAATVQIGTGTQQCGSDGG